MNAISDPGRPSRRDRRKAQKLVDTAFSERRLTAADRALRTQRIAAAHTRGDLATITRDLVAHAPTNLGRALDASTMASMRTGSPAWTKRIPGTSFTASPGTPTIDLSRIGRRVRLFVLLALVGVFASCVLGLVALIAAVFTGVTNDGSTSDAPSADAPGANHGTSEVVEAVAADLHTAAGWTALVDAIEAESGTTEIYDLVVYPEYAAVGLDADGTTERRFYRNGAWQDSVSVRTPSIGSLTDLAEIDPTLIARLPKETAQYFAVDNPTGMYVLVNAYSGSPQISVYVQTNGESRYRTYRLDGTPIS